MSSDLFKENRKLRSQLQLFLAEARKNEEKMQRFDEHERRLLSTTSLVDLLQLIIYQTRDAFGLDVITLSLLDPDYEFSQILEANGLQLKELPEFIIEPVANNLNYTYSGSQQPKLGEFRVADHGMLFPSGATQPCSVALLPLVRQNRLVGSLNFGSLDSDRYNRNSGTAFLKRLAMMVAICMENALNHERLKQVGFTDPLTRVHNRRFFDQRLIDEVSAADRYEQPLVCMFLDVDHFKQVNDTLGHQAGDMVLIQIAELINKKLRRHDILSRYGGEEFVALLTNTPLHAAVEIAERTRELIASHSFRLNDGTATAITISIGLGALSNQEHLDVEAASRSLLQAADEAVYQAKEKGRNRVEVMQLQASESS
ncbi:MAG: sensor domain-containing diguanylate cyclase [Pseudomonadota bacterium]